MPCPVWTTWRHPHRVPERSRTEMGVEMKFQHKVALAVLGSIFVVLAVLLLISFIQGDDTNSNNRPGGGVGIAHMGS
jgi:hypothetical protein